MTDAPFIFETYAFDRASGILRLRYRYEGGTQFEERITFPNPPQDLSPARFEAFDKACRLVFLLAGVSYYKAYVPTHLKCEAFPLTHAWASFIETVYRNGLGEFAYRNKLNLKDKIKFETQTAPLLPAVSLGLPHHLLVPVGGGKDSIVSIETLKKTGLPITLYAQCKALDDVAAPIAATIETSQLPALKVARAISPSLIELNKTGALNGHVPITAILSSIAVASAVLYGYDTVILSNEHSASAPNLVIDGMPVNHQYSKSLDFEREFSAFVTLHIARDLKYFSLLRPLTEAAIAKRFARFKNYHGIFRSCNTAFRQDPTKRGTNWCCDCPKCRFVFLALSPFTPKAELVSIFGRDMLDDVSQTEGFSELTGLGEYKPFECVGEIEESALLMEKLTSMNEWKDDAVVRDLGTKLAAETKDFSKLYEDLFRLRSDHRVPTEFMKVLDENR